MVLAGILMGEAEAVAPRIVSMPAEALGAAKRLLRGG